MQSTFRAPVPTRGPFDPACISGRHSVLLRCERKPLRCCAQSINAPEPAPKPRKDVVEVRQLKAYDEYQNRLVSRAEAATDEEGSIANFVPGGRASERPSQAGAQEAERLRESKRPLKINVDMQLV
jgi:hypothetical protein